MKYIVMPIGKIIILLLAALYYAVVILIGMILYICWNLKFPKKAWFIEQLSFKEEFYLRENGRKWPSFFHWFLDLGSLEQSVDLKKANDPASGGGLIGW